MLHAPLSGSPGDIIRATSPDEPLASRPVSIDVVRREWEEGHRRLEAARANPEPYRRLLAQVEAITEELRKRVGSTFTLAQLAEAYRGAERWSRDVVAENAPAPGWPRTLTVAEDAAFHLYQRGAVDYRP